MREPAGSQAAPTRERHARAKLATAPSGGSARACAEHTIAPHDPRNGAAPVTRTNHRNTMHGFLLCLAPCCGAIRRSHGCERVVTCLATTFATSSPRTCRVGAGSFNRSRSRRRGRHACRTRETAPVHVAYRCCGGTWRGSAAEFRRQAARFATRSRRDRRVGCTRRRWRRDRRSHRWRGTDPPRGCGECVADPRHAVDHGQHDGDHRCHHGPPRPAARLVQGPWPAAGTRRLCVAWLPAVAGRRMGGCWCTALITSESRACGRR